MAGHLFYPSKPLAPLLHSGLHRGLANKRSHSQPDFCPQGTQTKHSSSSETGIEISLKSMDFKTLVAHDGQWRAAHRYCYRGLEVAWPELSLQRAQRTDKQTLQGLGEGALTAEVGGRARGLGPFGTLNGGWGGSTSGKTGPSTWRRVDRECRAGSPSPGLRAQTSQ